MNVGADVPAAFRVVPADDDGFYNER